MNNKPKVYIDGKDGTTGLQIYDRLAARDDIDLLLIDEEKRKNPDERKKLLNAADLAFLCLPDAAAIEAVNLVENSAVKIIDCSTAHRTSSDWAYGFPELSKARKNAIQNGKRVANPGCHATGFISIIYPLVHAIPELRGEIFSCFSLTGYSGGGKKMIAEYENPARDVILNSPALYGLGQNHKHIPEMKKVCGLDKTPLFTPIVDDYYKGMATTVSVHMDMIKNKNNNINNLDDMRDIYIKSYGESKIILIPDNQDKDLIQRLYAGSMAGKDTLKIFIFGNDERFTITALFDNLGKGASGAAVQNMNLMLGFEETKGLNL